MRRIMASVAALPTAGRAPWILTAVTVAIAVVLSSLGDRLFLRMAPQLGNLMAVQRELQSDSRFFSVSVFEQTFYENGNKTSRVLVIRVWYKGLPTEATRTKVMNEIAETVLSSLDTARFDLLRVEIHSSYDLGFATGNLIYGDGQPVSVWRERVAKTTSPRASPSQGALRGIRRRRSSARRIALMS